MGFLKISWLEVEVCLFISRRCWVGWLSTETCWHWAWTGQPSGRQSNGCVSILEKSALAYSSKAQIDYAVYDARREKDLMEARWIFFMEEFIYMCDIFLICYIRIHITQRNNATSLSYIQSRPLSDRLDYVENWMMLNTSRKFSRPVKQIRCSSMLVDTCERTWGM